MYIVKMQLISMHYQKKPFIILGMQFNIVMEQKYTTEKYKYL